MSRGAECGVRIEPLLTLLSRDLGVCSITLTLRSDSRCRHSMYPKYKPWVYVTPTIARANVDGKLCVDVPWDPGTSMFADVVGAVIAHVEAV